MQRVEPRIRARDNRPKPKSRWKRITLITLVVFWTAIVTAFVAGSLFLWWRLDQANALVPGLQGRLESEITRPSEIVSSDGTVLLRLAAEYRDPVNYQDIPKHVVDATIAAEDKRYFEHDGVDTIAMMRVLWGRLSPDTQAKVEARLRCSWPSAFFRIANARWIARFKIYRLL